MTEPAGEDLESLIRHDLAKTYLQELDAAMDAPWRHDIDYDAEADQLNAVIDAEHAKSGGQ